MKIVLLGGGGFRVPMVYDALRRSSFAESVEELVLHDIDAPRLRRVASVISGLDEDDAATHLPFRTTITLPDAAEGAAFVLCAIRVGGLEGRVIDERVPLDLGVLGQETTGPAGIAFALRTVPVMLEIAATVATRAPDSWFLNLTNPAGLVTEAVQGVLGDRAIGICDAPAALCARVAAALGRRPRELRFDYVGLNHLGWLNRAETDGGRDLLPELLADDRGLAAIDEARLLGVDRVREMGALPNEYVVYHERASDIARSLRARSRGEVLLEQQSRFYEGEERAPAEALAAWRAAKDLRHGTYMSEAWTTSPPAPSGTVPIEGPGEEGYAAVAAEVISALAGGDVAGSPILGVANRGAVGWLDDAAVVEVPCEVGAGGVAPRQAGPVPDEQRSAIERMKEVERLTIRAARERSSELALRAIARHPLVPSRDVAERIWGGYIAHHASLREAFR